MLERLLLLRQIPLARDFGRLFLRIGAFLPLFLKHGAEKLFTFHAMSQQFVTKNLDPVHIGPVPSLVIAMIADGICSLLIMVGFATRWAALFLFCNLFVVWSIMDHFVLLQKGPNSGEALVLYMTACLTIFFLGAGRISIDGLIESSREKKEGHQEQAKFARA